MPNNSSEHDYPDHYASDPPSISALQPPEVQAPLTPAATSSRAVIEQPADKQKKRTSPTNPDSSGTKKRFKPAAPKAEDGKSMGKDKGKGKGKAKPKEDDEDEDGCEDDAGPRSGRQTGSRNYSQADIKILLDVVEEVLPIGADMWACATKLFNQQAKKIGRPTREQKPLKTKFEAVSHIYVSWQYIQSKLSLFAARTHTETHRSCRDPPPHRASD